MVSDPQMLGGHAGDWARQDGETYFTERPAVVALYDTLQRLGFRGVPPLPHRIWEPACGANAIAAELEARGHDVFASDVADYAGCYGYRALQRPPRALDFLAAPEFEPFDDHYAIVTNPPFDDRAQGGRTAELFLRHALAKPRAAVVWFLLRNDYDLSNEERPDLFDRPDWAMKIALRWRPSWSTPAGPIVPPAKGPAYGRSAASPEEPRAGSPRHAYAWFGWFRLARPRWPGARLVLADRPRDPAQAAPDHAPPDTAGRLPRVPQRPPVRHWQDKEDE